MQNEKKKQGFYLGFTTNGCLHKYENKFRKAISICLIQ